MRVLLLAGLGPYFKSKADLEGTFFDTVAAPRLEQAFRTSRGAGVRLDILRYSAPDGHERPLLRPEQSGSLSLMLDGGAIDRPPVPNLVASTVSSILTRVGVDHDYLPLDDVWTGDREPANDVYDVVLLSTTFICDRSSLARALRWVTLRFPKATIVLGGQFSNLKYASIMRRHPEVDFVVRGDAEVALALLMDAIRVGDGIGAIPNLVGRNGSAEGIAVNTVEYIDLDQHSSPSFDGWVPVAPYESMRGCPFRCKFCSFPAASPLWRYKSATRIVEDWTRYRDHNGTRHVRAMDSTFTVPPRRFHTLLAMLADVGIGWEAFARANAITDAGLVERLAAAGCRTLSIGFESMSDNSLDYMNKKVSASNNQRAFELLHGSGVGYRMSFMVGYPGETPDDYGDTHDFLVDRFAGHFQLYVFSLQDETMPVWEDAERFGLEVHDANDPDYSWAHVGMDVETARALRARTLREVRQCNDDAVALLWQPDHQTPLLPHLGAGANYRVEKLVERLAFVPIDVPDPRRATPVLDGLLAELDGYGVVIPAVETTRC